MESETTAGVSLQDELSARCEYWQAVLRLRDWDIQAKFIHRHLFPDCRAAHVTIEAQHKVAIIEIGWPDQFDESTDPFVMDRNRDWESHLVHELIHLHLGAWNPAENSLEETAMEQAVNIICGALVALERTGDEKDSDGD